MKSDLRAEIRRLPVHCTVSGIHLGLDELVQSAECEPKDPSEFELPAPVRSGGTLESVPEEEAAAAAHPFLPAKSVGECRVTLEQAHEMFVEQASLRDGTYSMFCRTNMQYHVDGSEACCVSFRAQYKNKLGDWIDCDRFELASRNGPYHYSWIQGTSLTVHPNELKEIALCAGIDIAGVLQSSLHKRRIHPFFPRPITVRYVMETLSGESSVIDIEHSDRPLVLPTQLAKAKDGSLFWLQCDDTNTEDRIYCNITMGESNDHQYLDVNVNVGVTTKRVYLYKSTLSRFAYLKWKALSESKDAGEKKVKEGEGEADEDDEEAEAEAEGEASTGGESKGVRPLLIAIPDLCYRPSTPNSALSCAVHAAVDPSRRQVYALRISLSTSSSKARKYFRVPIMF
eukprot:TRINITY_DN4388_c0_g1_i2.p1 TRINITY_DN4388_c0_g1~~TRINITY_DN4388_c0_g1_i2.p1  ORF type:complete len:399 (-),score=109.60 TRINITY_DN4388_c0_g1_i2:419-1615(-)